MFNPFHHRTGRSVGRPIEEPPAGSSTETVNRVLSTWRRDGAPHYEGGGPGGEAGVSPVQVLDQSRLIINRNTDQSTRLSVKLFV